MVEGDATGEDDQGQDSICRQVMDQRDDDKSGIGKANERDVKEQVLPDDWDMEKKGDKNRKYLRRRKTIWKKKRLERNPRTSLKKTLKHQKRKEVRSQKTQKR
jgi:hypothetical protein